MKKAMLTLAVAMTVALLSRPVQATPITDLYIDDSGPGITVSFAPPGADAPSWTYDPLSDSLTLQAPMYVTGPSTEAYWNYHILEYANGPISDVLSINWYPAGYISIFFQSDDGQGGAPGPLGPPVQELIEQAGWQTVTVPQLNNLNVHFRSEPGQVPDGGMAVALLGFALVGLEGLRRKLTK